MNQLIFKEEWDCLTPEGRIDYSKLYYEYANNIDEFYKRAGKQENEYLELNKEYIIEHRKRFDKALLFDFHDNDFSAFINDMMVGNFIPNINNILNYVDAYVNDDSVERSLNEEFDRDTLLVKMKYWFVAQYMCYGSINWEKNKGYNSEVLDKYYKDAKRLVDYLFKEADLFIDTNKRINQLIKERYSEGCDDSYDVPRYWTNGEVFILRIIDNKVTYTII